jgi:hypothetical protein
VADVVLLRQLPTASSGPRASLELTQTGKQISERDERLERGDVDQCAIEHQARLQRLPELVAAAQHAVEHLRDPRAVDAIGFTPQCFPFVLWCIDELAAIGSDLKDREVA